MNIREKINFLKVISSFCKIAEDGLEEIAKTLLAEEFSPNEFVIKQGGHGLNFYIIIRGLRKVYALDYLRLIHTCDLSCYLCMALQHCIRR